ncbi:uncharacterized protein LOC143038782 [Oratosquilla oratoria]|uniref:uncharacterized protein LOC143038782 n=1 Tax=Oratosquilla oratoria TaxID=337810 RepID=UPI003F771200
MGRKILLVGCWVKRRQQHLSPKSLRTRSPGTQYGYENIIWMLFDASAFGRSHLCSCFRFALRGPSRLAIEGTRRTRAVQTPDDTTSATRTSLASMDIRQKGHSKEVHVTLQLEGTMESKVGDFVHVGTHVNLHNIEDKMYRRRLPSLCFHWLKWTLNSLIVTLVKKLPKPFFVNSQCFI